MTKKKQKLSLLSKILLITECSAVVLLLLLCAYKNNLPTIVDEFIGKDVVAQTKPDVVLDAGHGGYDVGAMYEDYYEKDITLAMTKEIGKIIEEAGYQVTYTRDSDEIDWASNERADLAYRTNVSNQSGAKLFVSLHINSEEYDMGTYGYESWAKLNDQTALTLSENILQEVDTLDYSQNRGIQDESRSPLHVISKNKVPAILFEVGFIGSSNDQKYLFNDTYQKRFSNKIAQGIIKTLMNMDNSAK